MNILLSLIISVVAISGCKATRDSANPSNISVLEDTNLKTSVPVTGLVELKGNIALPQSGKLYLWNTYGKQTEKADSTQIVSGNFSFGKKEYAVGIYMVGTSENNMCPVILHPNEPLCEIGFKTGKLETSLYAIHSKENEGWSKYMAQEPTLLRAIKDAKVAAAKTPDKKAHFEQQAAKKEQELLTLRNSLIAEYPGTYLAKLLGWKQEPDKTDIEKYWNNIDFTDESIIRSKALPERIESFMRIFSKGEESGFIRCVDVVAEKAKANDAVLEFVLSQMLTGFYESNLENICAYIIDHYIYGDACGDADLSNVIKNTATGIQNLGAGKTPPNIVMPDTDSHEVNLYTIAAKNKYTLVMFWSSWCEHCKHEAPQVKTCYDHWHKNGFEIIGVSIDSNVQVWKSAVNERGFTFPNVCGMNQYRSAVAQDYRITKTPTFFLLDNHHKIVLKPKSIKEVQTFLAENMKQ